jgi:hypothetical protein
MERWNEEQRPMATEWLQRGLCSVLSLGHPGCIAAECDVAVIQSFQCSVLCALLLALCVTVFALVGLSLLVAAGGETRSLLLRRYVQRG